MISHTHFPNYESLDARIAPALNKIIQNSYFKKKVSLEEQKAQKDLIMLRFMFSLSMPWFLRQLKETGARCN